jgi:hypothetical protein
LKDTRRLVSTLRRFLAVVVLRLNAGFIPHKTLFVVLLLLLLSGGTMARALVLLLGGDIAL